MRDGIYGEHALVFGGRCIEESFARGDASIVEENRWVPDFEADSFARGGDFGGFGEVAFEEMRGGCYKEFMFSRWR